MSGECGKITKAGLETALSLGSCPRTLSSRPTLSLSVRRPQIPTSPSMWHKKAPQLSDSRNLQMIHAVFENPDEKAEIDDGPLTFKDSYHDQEPNWLPSCYGEVNLDLISGLNGVRFDVWPDSMPGDSPTRATPTRSWDSTYENFGFLEHRGSTWDGAASHNSVITEHGFPRS